MMPGRARLPDLVRSRRVTALVLPALVAGALAGCGGDDGDDSAAETAKIDFQETVDRLCRESTAASEKEARTVLRDKKVLRLKRDERNAVVIGRLTDVARTYYKKLSAVEAPEDYKADFTKYVARLNETFTHYDGIEAAYRKADFDRVSELNQKIADLGKANLAFAKKYGLKSCEGGAAPAPQPGGQSSGS
jgi:hypothetical protein